MRQSLNANLLSSCHLRYVLIAFGFAVVILIVLYFKSVFGLPFDNTIPSTESSASFGIHTSLSYNQSYPLSKPDTNNGVVTYLIGLVADLDEMSTMPNANNTWQSYFKKGYLSYSAAQQLITVSFDDEEPTPLVHHFALDGRGMELSELVTFDGHLLTMDDRTGIIYKMSSENQKVIPWVVLMDGDGQSTKGFKCEWATVKDDHLYVGSLGKEWTSSLNGEIETFDPMWVKVISMSGQVSGKTK